MPKSAFGEDCHRKHSEKVWLKKNHNCKRSSILKCFLPQGMCHGKVQSLSKKI